jgi:hypothetical protein
VPTFWVRASLLMPPLYRPTGYILTGAPIVVSGTPAYDEDSWTKIRLTDPSHKEDQLVFHVSCRTTRLVWAREPFQSTAKNIGC